MSKTALPPPEDKEMTLVEHLLELRDRLTKAVLAVIVLFVVLFPFANDLYLFIAEPLMRYMPSDGGMIATAVASPFLTPFKLSLVLAIYLAMPVILYQLWAFIAPGLYTHEKQLVGPLLFSSVFLFYAGGLFAYYVVFPLVFQFLTSTAPEGVTIATDISLYLDFVIKMFFAFGVAFEVPIATVLLILTGTTTPEKLAHARPYVIVGAFVIGMLLTPPDVISQTLLAVPMWLLYELGVWIGALILRRRRRDDETPEDDPTPPKAGPEGPDTPSSGGGAGSAATTAAATGALAVSADAEPGLSFNENQPSDTQDDAAPQADEAASDRTSTPSPDPITDPSHPDYDPDRDPANMTDDDDDFDWEAEFDKIEAEMAALEGKTHDRGEAESGDGTAVASATDASSVTEMEKAQPDQDRHPPRPSNTA